MPENWKVLRAQLWPEDRQEAPRRLPVSVHPDSLREPANGPDQPVLPELGLGHGAGPGHPHHEPVHQGAVGGGDENWSVLLVCLLAWIDWKEGGGMWGQ